MAKKKVGFILPTEIAAALNKASEGLGGKEKWVVLTAALVCFLRQPRAAQNAIIAEVKGQDSPGGDFGSLIPRRGDPDGVPLRGRLRVAQPTHPPSSRGVR